MPPLRFPTALHQEVAELTSSFFGAQARVDVHVDVFDGQFGSILWDDGGGPDTFELEIGNRIRYAAPIGAHGLHFQQLQARWLPYYGDDLRARVVL